MTNELPAHSGIEDGYHDVFGNWHPVNPQTRYRLINALKTEAEFASPPERPETMSAFQGDGARRWGLAVQLYALRSTTNWGIGDFGDLQNLIGLAADAGADAIGLNPIHALFIEKPELNSPYAPNSRLFFNPLYIDVGAVPESSGIGALELDEQIDACRDSEFVNYKDVAAAKIKALRFAYDNLTDSRRKKDFADFRATDKYRLRNFSCFEVLRQRHRNAPWRSWSAPWRDADSEALSELHQKEAVECGFHEYLQWVAHEQLQACQALAKRKGMSIGLYLDLAVGVHPDGFDAWINQHSVLTDFSIGAPPDEFNQAGQDWGLSPYNPRALSENDFALFRELLAKSMMHAGALRLDHVLGLMRLFVIPHGTSAKEGAYIRYPFEQLLRVVAEESHRYRCIFIGEDLGTVPEGFRDTMERWGIWTYRVMMFERRHDREFKSPDEYPPQSLATFSTHDLSTFRGWMTGHDMSVKRAINIDPGESDEDRQRAREALGRAVSPFNGSTETIVGPASHLASSPSRLVMISAEDILGMLDQTNVPGTMHEHPNWQRKLPAQIEDWPKNPVWTDIAAMFRRVRPRHP